MADRPSAEPTTASPVWSRSLDGARAEAARLGIDTTGKGLSKLIAEVKVERGRVAAPIDPAGAQPATPVAAAAATAATSPSNDLPQPTQAQKEAGNYRKGHVVVNGHDISIENPAGSQRDPKWPPLANHYGYIKGTVGRDKDHVDVFMTDRAEDPALPVFVIDQRNKDGSFDEHKVVMGATDEADARATYLANYSPGWTGLGGITEMTQEQFRKWVRDPKKTKRPAARAARRSAAPASAPMATAPAPATAAPERRQDAAAREAIDQMPQDARDAEIARLRAEVAEANRRADTDARTGIKGPGAYDRDLAAAGGVAAIDLKLFKGYNTLLTDKGGDQVLAAFGAAMREAGGEQAYRRGGDEFAFLADSPEAAQAMVDRLREAEGRIVLQVQAGADTFTVAGVPFAAGVGADEDAAIQSRDAGKGEYDRNALPGNVRRAQPEPAADQLAGAGSDGTGAARRGEDRRGDAGTEGTGRRRAAAVAAPTAAVPPKKIDDFGEVLHGARKHYAAAFADRMRESMKLDLATHPLSKAWPEPDYEKLIEGGADARMVALVHALRDQMPAKPQSAWKLNSWVKLATELRGVSNRLLTGDISASRADKSLEVVGPVLRNQIETGTALYQEVGHAKSLKGIRIAHASYSVYKGQSYSPARMIWTIERKNATGFGNWPHILGEGVTRDEAIADFRSRYDTMDAPAEEKKAETRFQIYSRRGAEGFWIGKKQGRDMIDLKKFDDVKAAREFLANNRDELMDLLAKAKEIPASRREKNEPRVGVDHRGGADVSPAQFSEAFGFRGVQFGNYVEDRRRQGDLNQAYDALMDLAGVVGIPPRALSLNGTLGLAFGARGKGGKMAPSAHFEATTVVINLTKANGPGSLAHEWWHGLDNYFARMRASGKSFVTESPKGGGGQLREEMRAKFEGIVRTLRETGLPQRSEALDNLRSKPYWSTDVEMTARAFENYVIAKLGDEGLSNDYLVNIVGMDGWTKHGGYPYLDAAEVPAVRAAYDEFFQTLQVDTSEPGTARLFSKGDAAGGLPMARAQALKRDLTAKWGDGAPRVVLVESAEALQAAAGLNRDVLDDPDFYRAEGLYNGSPTVWINLARIPDEQRFAAVLAHEALGHYGVERVIGADEWRSISGAIARHRAGTSGALDVRTAIARVEQTQPGLDADAFAREVVAVLAEMGSRNNLLQRVIAAVNRFLRRVMPGYAWRDTDIRDLLNRADSFMRAGTPAEARGERVRASAFSMATMSTDGRGARRIAMGGETFVDRGGTFYLAKENGEPRDFVTATDAQAAAAATGGEVRLDPAMEGERATWSVVVPPTQVRAASVGGFSALFSKAAPADALADIEAVMAGGQQQGVLARARAWLADMTPAKLKDAARETWLGALTTRHLTELGSDYLPTMKTYTDILAEMGADRNKLQAESEELVEGLRKWSGKNQPEAQQLFKLMHDSTIDGLDPSVDYEPLMLPAFGGVRLPATRKNLKAYIKAQRELMLGRAGDSKVDRMNEVKAARAMEKAEEKRLQAFPALVQRYAALSPEAKQYYAEVRDAYRSRSDAIEDALIARIEDTDAAPDRKAKMISMLRQQFETHRLQGVYFPLQRFGRHFVAAERDGTATFLMFEKLSELERAVKDLKGRGFTITAQGLKSAGKAQDAPSGTFVAEVVEQLRKSGVSEKTQDEVYQIYLEALPELSMRKHAIHRKAVPGFDPDAVRALAFNMHHGAHQLARLRHGHKLQNVLGILGEQQDSARRQPDADTRRIAAGDAILGELGKRHEWINNPQDSQLTNIVSSFGFVYYLGVSPAAALVNLTQTAMVSYPFLAARFGGVKAMNYLLAAGRDSIGTLGNIQKRLTDPDELRAHAVLQEMGALDKTQAHNLAGIAESGMAGYSPKWAKAMEIIGWGFHKTEVVNREATGLAAFRLARAEGKTFNEAVDFAAQAINDTHFDYTNANRARFMQSGTAKIVLMFRQYSLNMTWHLARMVWQASKGETPEVKRTARRNLAGILGMSSLFSGVLGLPMASVAMGVLNSISEAFGDDDEPWNAETEFRAFLADMLGPDIAETLLTGVANQVTGADIGGRVSLNQLWFRDADRELDGRGAFYNLLEQAAGPMGGVLKNALVGKQLMEEGQVWRGVETMLPKSLKDGMKAVRFKAEGVNNLRGDAIVEDVNLYQALLQVNGFSPKQVAERYDQNRALKNYETAITDRRRRLIDGYAMAHRLGDNEAIREYQRKIDGFNESYPQIAITGKTIRTSIKNRARYSERAENGIFLNPKLAEDLRARVGVDTGE